MTLQIADVMRALVSSVEDGKYLRRSGSSLCGDDGPTAPEGYAYGVFAAENKSGMTLPAGTVMAIHSSGTGIVAASAANGTKPAVGLLQATAINGIAGDVQTSGPMTLADWSAITGSATLTRGPYFLDVTAGLLTAIAPSAVGQVVQIVGYAVSSTILDITPAAPVLL